MERNPEIEKLFNSWKSITGNLNADVASYLTFAQILHESTQKLLELSAAKAKPKKKDNQIEMDV